MVSTLEMANRTGELVQIRSVNPLQAGPKGGTDGETELAHRIANWSESLGADVVLDEVLPGRPNVYARFAGQTDRVVVIDTHLDTVSVEHMTRDPFDGVIEDDRLYGRGSVDTKATFAIVLSIMEELAADKTLPIPTVYLVGTVSEESGGLLGAAGFAKWVKNKDLGIDQMIVAEPTLCAPVYGHKGFLGMDLTVHGHAAHSSKPELGANAISGAARIITAVDEENIRLGSTEAPTAVGNGTITVNTIEGGLATNIIPDACKLHAGRRVAPGEDPYQLFKELSELMTDAAKPLDLEIQMYGGMAVGAFFEDPQGTLIQQIAQMAGREPEATTYGSNACLYPGLAGETLLFGPGSIDQAHQAVEWIDVAEIGRAADIYRTLLRAD